MSRGQQQQVMNTASGENKTLYNEGQTSFDTAGQDINNFSDEVGAFKAQNPYVQGGQAETAENQGLSDVAAGAGTSAGQAIQGAAVRGGQNAGQSIAATKNIQQNNTRALMGAEAGATEQRLGAGTGYNEAVLKGEGETENMQDQLAQQQTAAAQGALGTEEKASETPSFWDEFGNAFATQSGKAASQGAQAAIMGG